MKAVAKLLIIMGIISGIQAQNKTPEYHLDEVLILAKKHKLRKRFVSTTMLSKASVPYTAYEVPSDEAQNLTYKTGTQINIPAKAFKTRKGELYKGTVILFYREIRSSVDIFLERISMRTDKGVLLSSAGMFEIIPQGENGELLQLAKPIAIKRFKTAWTRKPLLWFYDATRKVWKKLPQAVNLLPVSEEKKQELREKIKRKFPYMLRETEPIVPQSYVETEINRPGFYNYDTTVLRVVPRLAMLKRITRGVADFDKPYVIKGDFGNLEVWKARKTRLVITYENSNAVEIMTFKEAQEKRIGSAIGIIPLEDKIYFVTATRAEYGCCRRAGQGTYILYFRVVAEVENDRQARRRIANRLRLTDYYSYKLWEES